MVWSGIYCLNQLCNEHFFKIPLIQLENSKPAECWHADSCYYNMISEIYTCDRFCVLVLSMSLASLPALEWTLPSSTEQYELRIEVQPRQHHRAHYETEGSRGAVKAVSGGHPVVQVKRECVLWVVSLTCMCMGACGGLV